MGWQLVHHQLDRELKHSPRACARVGGGETIRVKWERRTWKGEVVAMPHSLYRNLPLTAPPPPTAITNYGVVHALPVCG